MTISISQKLFYISHKDRLIMIIIEKIECSTKIVFTDLASGKLSTCSHFPDSISNNSTESNAPFWLYPPMMRIAVLLTGTVQKLNKYDHIVYPEWFNIHIWIHNLYCLTLNINYVILHVPSLSHFPFWFWLPCIWFVVVHL